MLPIIVIPHGRTATDKTFYLVSRYWIKQNRKVIETKIREMNRDFMLFGEYKGVKRVWGRLEKKDES